MAVTQELIPLSSPARWKDTLKGVPHAFGHTWESCYAMHLTSGLATYLYCFADGDIKIVCPIAEREYQGLTDIVTPYGFSGFIGSLSHSGWQKAWQELAKDRGYVCGYIGLNPIFEETSCLQGQEVFVQNTLYVLDLTLSLDNLFKNLSTNRRRQLKSYGNSLSTFTLDKETLKVFFLQNYHAFFAQRKASQVYNFSFETLSYLLDLENVMLVGKIGDDGQIEAVSVFGYTPSGAEYLFNVSLPEGKQHAVPLLWHAINLLKQKNIPLVNLGGGVKENDSIAEFKERFGALKYPLKSLKQIYRQRAYEQLCKEANVDGTDMAGFFPPYRKPSLIAAQTT